MERSSKRRRSQPTAALPDQEFSGSRRRKPLEVLSATSRVETGLHRIARELGCDESAIVPARAVGKRNGLKYNGLAHKSLVSERAEL
jgi:hypothetical protein